MRTAWQAKILHTLAAGSMVEFVLLASAWGVCDLTESKRAILRLPMLASTAQDGLHHVRLREGFTSDKLAAALDLESTRSRLETL